MVDRFDLGGIGAVLAGGVAAVYSWAAGLGVGTILLSVGVGSLLTYMVQTKAQKSAWQRESALRKVDEIYGPLFNEITAIAKSLTENNPLTQRGDYPRNLDQPDWKSIKAGYRYYLIEQRLRGILDGFYWSLENLEANQRKIMPMIDSKLLPEVREVFGKDVQALQYNVAATHQNGMPVNLAGSFLYDPILLQKSPLEYERERSPGYADYELELSIQRGGTMTKLFGKEKPDMVSSTKFNKLVAECSEEVAKDPTVVLVQQQAAQLSKETGAVLSELRTVIERPWTV